jgi:tetratricopeptide (TPR) repeat protein
LILFDEGDYVSAEPLARAVLAADQRELRPDDPNLAVSLNNLGRILRAEQKGEEALALYRQADANLAKARHPFRATFLGNIGQLECERGNIDVALPAFSEGLALGSELLGERHADVVTIREKLGRCLVQHRRYDEAERALLAVFNAWDVSFGASPERRQRATRAVVDLYDAWGKPDKAREWRAKLAAQNTTVASPTVR